MKSKMQKWLERLKDQKEQRIAEVEATIRGSQDVDEVRSLGPTLQALRDELADIEEQIAEADEGEGSEDAGEARVNDPSAATEARGVDPHAAYARRSPLASVASFTTEADTSDDEDPFGTEEYRRAFMGFVTRGTPIPDEFRSAEVQAEFRADAMTTTADASAVIPTTLVRRIVSELSTHGNIWAKVTKTNVPGGMEIPVMDLKPVASWITETGKSDDQKLEANKTVSFKYHTLECRLAQSLLASVVTLSMFEDKFVELAIEACVLAIEAAIMSGDGKGKPLGILKDTRVKTANVVTLSPDEIGKWDVWKKKVFAKMKKSYRKGDFIMAQGTFDGYIDGMVDAVGQPIGRVNYGIDGPESYRFGGKDVETVEDDVIPDYEAATVGDVIAVFANLADYAVNSNMQMQTVKWIDHDNNKVKNKVTMICDGKLIDPNGVIVVKKGAAAANASGDGGSGEAGK